MNEPFDLKQFNDTYEAERLQRWARQLEDETRHVANTWREIREAEVRNDSNESDNFQMREGLREREVVVCRRELRADFLIACAVGLFVVSVVCLVASVLVR